MRGVLGLRNRSGQSANHVSRTVVASRSPDPTEISAGQSSRAGTLPPNCALFLNIKPAPGSGECPTVGNSCVRHDIQLGSASRLILIGHRRTTCSRIRSSKLQDARALNRARARAFTGEKVKYFETRSERGAIFEIFITVVYSREITSLIHTRFRSLCRNELKLHRIGNSADAAENEKFQSRRAQSLSFNFPSFCIIADDGFDESSAIAH